MFFSAKTLALVSFTRNTRLLLSMIFCSFLDRSVRPRFESFLKEWVSESFVKSGEKVVIFEEKKIL